MKKIEATNYQIYLLFILFNIGLCFYFYNDYARDKEILEYGELVRVKVKKMYCKSINYKKLYFDYSNQEYFLNVGSSFCQRHSVGDIVDLLYSKRHDQFLFKKSSISLFKSLSIPVFLILMSLTQMFSNQKE